MGCWRAIADACHAAGAVVLAALGHSGMQGSSAYSQRETWAPSRVPDAVTIDALIEDKIAPSD